MFLTHLPQGSETNSKLHSEHECQPQGEQKTLAECEFENVEQNDGIYLCLCGSGVHYINQCVSDNVDR